MQRKPVIATLVVASALTVTGCAGGASTSSSSSASTGAGNDPIVVVASTNVWGDIATTIGGDSVTVTSIINSPDQDPHEYEANAQNQLSLSKAKVVIENGGGYDDFIDTMLSSSGNKTAKVLNAVDISGKTAASGEELNEHVWYDLPTTEKVIDQIESALSAADSSDADTFRKNADDLKSKVSSLQQRESDLKGQHSGTAVSITEPVPLYMLEAIGLENKTPEAFSEAIEEDTDVPATVLQQTLALYTKHEVKMLAYNEQTTGKQTEAVLAAAKENSVPVVPVTETLPQGKSYVSWMSANLDAVSDALGK